MAAVRGAGYRGDQRQLLAALMGALAIHVAVLLVVQLTGDRMAAPRRFEEVAIELVPPAPVPLPTPEEPAEVLPPEPPPVEPPLAEQAPAPATAAATTPAQSAPPAGPSAPDGRSATGASPRPFVDPRTVAQAAASVALGRLGALPTSSGTNGDGSARRTPTSQGGAVTPESGGAAQSGVSVTSQRTTSGTSVSDLDVGSLVGAVLAAEQPGAVSGEAGAGDPTTPATTSITEQPQEVGGAALEWDDQGSGRREPVSTPAPVIPEELQVRGGCTVEVRFTVDAKGLVSSTEVLRFAVGGLDAVVLDAVRSWRFTAEPGAAPASGRVTFVCEQP